MSVSFDEETFVAAARAGDFRKVQGPKTELIEAIRANQSVRGGDPREALRELTELTARLLEVGRVGVWVLDEAQTRLSNLDLLVVDSGRHTSGMAIAQADAPEYFSLLLAGEVLTIDDAMADPRTRELARGYLPTYGVTAMIDAPILIERKLAGVVCGEHLGGVRRWEGWERLLAGSLAECAGVAIAVARTHEGEGTRGRWRTLSVG